MILSLCRIPNYACKATAYKMERLPIGSKFCGKYAVSIAEKVNQCNAPAIGENDRTNMY